MSKRLRLVVKKSSTRVGDVGVRGVGEADSDSEFAKRTHSNIADSDSSTSLLAGQDPYISYDLLVSVFMPLMRDTTPKTACKMSLVCRFLKREYTSAQFCDPFNPGQLPYGSQADAISNIYNMCLSRTQRYSNDPSDATNAPPGILLAGKTGSGKSRIWFAAVSRILRAEKAEKDRVRKYNEQSRSTLLPSNPLWDRTTVLYIVPPSLVVGPSIDELRKSFVRDNLNNMMIITSGMKKKARKNLMNMSDEAIDKINLVVLSRTITSDGDIMVFLSRFKFRFMVYDEAHLTCTYLTQGSYKPDYSQLIAVTATPKFDNFFFELIGSRSPTARFGISKFDISKGKITVNDDETPNLPYIEIIPIYCKEKLAPIFRRVELFVRSILGFTGKTYTANHPARRFFEKLRDENDLGIDFAPANHTSKDGTYGFWKYLPPAIEDRTINHTYGRGKDIFEIIKHERMVIIFDDSMGNAWKRFASRITDWDIKVFDTVGSPPEVRYSIVNEFLTYHIIVNESLARFNNINRGGRGRKEDMKQCAVLVISPSLTTGMNIHVTPIGNISAMIYPGLQGIGSETFTQSVGRLLRNGQRKKVSLYIVQEMDKVDDKSTACATITFTSFHDYMGSKYRNMYAGMSMNQEILTHIKMDSINTDGLHDVRAHPVVGISHVDSVNIVSSDSVNSANSTTDLYWNAITPYIRSLVESNDMNYGFLCAARDITIKEINNLPTMELVMRFLKGKYDGEQFYPSNYRPIPLHKYGVTKQDGDGMRTTMRQWHEHNYYHILYRLMKTPEHYYNFVRNVIGGTLTTARNYATENDLDVLANLVGSHSKIIDATDYSSTTVTIVNIIGDVDISAKMLNIVDYPEYDKRKETKLIKEARSVNRGVARPSDVPVADSWLSSNLNSNTLCLVTKGSHSESDVLDEHNELEHSEPEELDLMDIDKEFDSWFS